MARESDPPVEGESTPPRARSTTPSILPRGHALGVPMGMLGVSGSLTSHWRRERRRIALEQRYGEDFVSGGDEDDIELLRPDEF